MDGVRKTSKLNIVKISIKNQFKIKGFFFLSKQKRGTFQGNRILDVVYFFFSKHPLLDIIRSKIWAGLQFTDTVWMVLFFLSGFVQKHTCFYKRLYVKSKYNNIRILTCKSTTYLFFVLFHSSAVPIAGQWNKGRKESRKALTVAS